MHLTRGGSMQRPLINGPMGWPVGPTLQPLTSLLYGHALHEAVTKKSVAGWPTPHMLRTVKIRLLFQRKTANFKQNQMEKKISTAANQESDGEKDFYGSKSHWQQNQSLGAESCAKHEDLEQQKKLTRGILQQQRERDLTGRLQKTQEKIQLAMNRSRGRKYTKTRGPVRVTQAADSTRDAETLHTHTLTTRKYIEVHNTVERLPPDLAQVRKGKPTAHTKCGKQFFHCNLKHEYNRSTEVTTLPLSFNYWNKNEFLTHFYYRNYEMKLGSDNESHPLGSYL
jgi:hypothetical protein